MEDNISQEQKAFNESEFGLERRINYGCHNGFHALDKSRAKFSAVGNLTRVEIPCMACGKIVIRDENLGVNDIIREVEQASGEAVKKAEDVLKRNNIGAESMAAAVAYERAISAKESDDFWANIKKGK